MKNETLNYLADKIIEDVRSKVIFSETILSDINSFPLVDFIREKVVESDTELMLELIKSDSLSICYLGLNLINKIQHLEKLQSELISIWDSTEGYKRRYFLMWALLNYMELPIEKHKEIFKYINDNWDQWKSDYSEFAGGSLNLKAFSKSRYYDIKFPKTKKWVYLLSLKAIGNKTDVRVAMKDFEINNEDPMIQLVLEELNK